MNPLPSDWDKDFDEFVKNLQNEIDEQAKRDFSKTVLKEFDNPQNLGNMLDADAQAAVTGPCGDTMEFSVKFKADEISEVKFRTNGCIATVACGSMLTQLVQHKTIKEALELKPEDLAHALEFLPPENDHCAVLAINTLKKALSNHGI